MMSSRDSTRQEIWCRGAPDLDDEFVVLGFRAGAEEHDAEPLVLVGHGQPEDPLVEVPHCRQVVYPQPGVPQLGDGHENPSIMYRISG
jgi:hypothetical protein